MEKTTEARAKEREELHESFKKLEQEWNALKESTSRKYLASSKATIKQNKPIRNYSPRELMFNLQQEESPTSTAEARKMRTFNDVAAQEILQERWEAIKSGKLKGRRLFQSTGESDNITTPQREVRLMSFYNVSASEDEYSSGSSKGVHDKSTRGCTYSSCLADVDQDVKEVARLVATIAEMRVASSIGRPRNIGRIRYAVFLGGFAIVLLVVAMCVCLARSSRGHNGDVILVPT